MIHVRTDAEPPAELPRREPRAGGGPQAPLPLHGALPRRLLQPRLSHTASLQGRLHWKECTVMFLDTCTIMFACEVRLKAVMRQYQFCKP